MFAVAGLGIVDNIIQKPDNDGQNVVFVAGDVGENVEVVSIAAVDEGEKSKRNR